MIQSKLIWSLVFSALYFLASNNNLVAAPCFGTSQWGSATAPSNTTPVTISTCNFQGDYSPIYSVVAGATYSIGNSCGGYITVTQGTPGGTVITHGNAPLSWTAPSAGTYYVHYHTNSACGTSSSCCTTTITCTSCGGGSDPCTSITSIGACGTSVTANMSGSGAGWSNLACVFSTPGDEVIYSFTAPTTGTYSLDVRY